MRRVILVRFVCTDSSWRGPPSPVRRMFSSFWYRESTFLPRNLCPAFAFRQKQPFLHLLFLTFLQLKMSQKWHVLGWCVLILFCGVQRQHLEIVLPDLQLFFPQCCLSWTEGGQSQPNTSFLNSDLNSMSQRISVSSHEGLVIFKDNSPVYCEDHSVCH